MKRFIVFETQNNKYVFDVGMKRIMLCHPIFFSILKHENENGKQNYCNDKKRSSKTSDRRNKNKKNQEYYQRKYQFLTKAGYFSDFDSTERLSGTISAEGIKNTLANLNQVTFEVCDSCNLKCKYCGYGEFYSDYDKRENKHLSLITAQKLLKFLAEFWNSDRNISSEKNIMISFYGGEPLLNMPFVSELIKFVKLLNVKYKRFSFSMTTNGVLLDKYTDFLVENDFQLLISLDGDEESNGYRIFKNNQPAFKRVLKNTIALRDRYPEYFKKNVNFNAVFHNKNSVSRIYNFFKKTFGKIPHIAELNPYGVESSRINEFKKMYADIADGILDIDDYEKVEREMFLSLPSIKSIAVFLHKYTGFVYQNYNDLQFPQKRPRRTPTGTCFPFYKKLFLTVNGKILPCERISHSHSLGYINDKCVEIDFDRVASKYNRYYDDARQLCSKCYNVETCQKCIFNFDAGQPGFTCDQFMGYSQFAEYLSKHMDYIESHPKLYSKIMTEVAFE